MKTLKNILWPLIVLATIACPCLAMRYVDSGSRPITQQTGFADGPNLYTYVKQNPWTKFDPMGLLGNDEMNFIDGLGGEPGGEAGGEGDATFEGSGEGGGGGGGGGGSGGGSAPSEPAPAAPSGAAPTKATAAPTPPPANSPPTSSPPPAQAGATPATPTGGAPAPVSPTPVPQSPPSAPATNSPASTTPASTPPPAAGSGSPNAAPNFIVSPGGTVFPVPEGATGPLPANNGLGFKYVGGNGGNGLAPNVAGVRFMDPTQPSGPSPGYPTGYGSYSNGATPTPQTVNPYTGQTIPKSDPWWHITAQ